MHSDIVTVNRNNQIFVSSIEVAQKFGKRHSDVLRVIHEYLNEKNMSDFNQRNFALIQDARAGRAKRGRPRLAEVIMSRDGFALAVMGFTGKKALEWKIRFLEAFNEMEQVIVSELPRLHARIAELESGISQKALPGRKKDMVAVPIMQEDLFGVVDVVRWELRHKETLDELTKAKARSRQMRKVLTGMQNKFDQLAERIDLLEGNKKSKLIRIIKDDPEKPL